MGEARSAVFLASVLLFAACGGGDGGGGPKVLNAAVGGLWEGNASSGTGSLDGTIQARASIAASSIFTTVLGGRTTGTVSISYGVLYNADSSLAVIAGNYQDFLGIYSGVLNISSNGELFLQDPGSGCVINGRVAIIDPAYNAYDVVWAPYPMLYNFYRP